MTLTVNTKYSGQRLDHPDFQDVAQTTYAKGVITDIQKTADDPFGVLPMVKVSLDGQEFGDYLPLFYHPKAQYWDGEDVQAQDYDAENKCFKQAWMSFRVVDEVVVLLQEGRPVSVIAFADGKPRIGEDIVKIEWPFLSLSGTQFLHLRCSTQELYGGLDVPKTGPDGEDLGLTEEITPVSDWFHKPAPALYPSTGGGLADYVLLRGYPSYRTVRDEKLYYTEACVPVGPILYIFQIFWSDQYLFSETGGTSGESPMHIEPLGAETGVWVNDSGGFAPEAGTQSESRSLHFHGIILRAGIYNQDLLDEIESRGPYSPSEAYANWSTWELLGTPYANTYLQESWNLWDMFAPLLDWHNYPQWSGSKFYVRSHDG